MPLEPSNEPKDTVSRFEKLLVALADAGVDYAVVGGLAVILNGYPRLTVDVDIPLNKTRGENRTNSTWRRCRGFWRRGRQDG